MYHNELTKRLFIIYFMTPQHYYMRYRTLFHENDTKRNQYLGDHHHDLEHKQKKMEILEFELRMVECGKMMVKAKLSNQDLP